MSERRNVRRRLDFEDSPSTPAREEDIDDDSTISPSSRRVSRRRLDFDASPPPVAPQNEDDDVPIGRMLDFGDSDMPNIDNDDDDGGNWDTLFDTEAADFDYPPGTAMISGHRFFYAQHHTVSNENFDDAIYQGCRFSNITFSDCTFSQTRFDACMFLNCHFINCRFTGTKFRQNYFFNVNFDNSDLANDNRMDDFKFYNSYFLDVNFTNIALQNGLMEAQWCRVNFQNCLLDDVSITRSNLSLVEFNGGSISGTPELFSNSQFSGSMFAHISRIPPNTLATLSNQNDIDNARRNCETLTQNRTELMTEVDDQISAQEERERVQREEEEAQEAALSAIAIAEQGSRARPEELRERAAALAAQTVVEERPAAVLTGPTCWDAIMMDSEQISNFLAEDPNNFVIGVKKPNGEIDYECQRLSDYQHDLIDPPQTDGRLPYKVFHECRDESPEHWDANNYGIKWYLPGGRTFVKMHSSKFIVLKPDWLFDGPVPEPRAFVLEREARDVRKFVTSELVPNIIPNFNTLGADHCNQKTPQAVYRLEPVTLDASGNVPLTYTLSGGKRKTRKGRGKNKKVTKKKNKKQNKHGGKHNKSRNPRKNKKHGRKSRRQ
jgi:fluoroquinolone resistance protein